MNKSTFFRVVVVALCALLGEVGLSTLNGQTVLNTTYNGTTIVGDVSMAPSTTATFTGGASFTGANATFGDYANFYWSQNGTLGGKNIAVGSAGTYAQIIVGANNSLTFDSATTVSGGVYIDGTTGASLTNQGAITQTSTATGYLFAPTLLNQGSVAVTSGGAFYFGYYNGESTTNATGGTLTADGANSRLYVHDLVNQGTVTAQNGGMVDFIGANATADLGNAQIGTGGGHLYLGGTLNNAASTLNAPTGGAFELYGGTINNGTVAAGALAFTNQGGTLNAVTYTGDLTLGSSAYVTFTGGTTFTGANASIADYGTLYWNQNGALAGKTITTGSTSGGYGVIDVGTNNSLTLGSATTVTGGIYIYGNSGSTVTNQGTIIQNSAGTGYLYAPTLINQGSVTVTGGGHLYFGYYNGESTTNAAGATLTADGANTVLNAHGLVNQGTVTAQNGGTVEFIGNNVTADFGNAQIGTGGGHLYLDGTLDNTAATLNAPTGGVFELYGGTISNGTIASGALAFTNQGGTLNAVTYTGNLGIGTGQYVTFTGGTTFTGANATLGDYAALYWYQNGTLAGKTFTMGSTSGAYGTILVGTNNSLTLDSATALAGGINLYGTTGASITNQGTIVDSLTGTGYIYAPTLLNQGSVTVGANSSLYFGYYNGESTTNGSGGTLTADGANARLYAHGLVNQGTVTAQNGGLVDFIGANATADLGNAQIGTGGGHLYLGGTLDNTAATLNAPTGGTYELYGGTINNGTVASGALTFTSQGGTLNAVSYTGDLGIGPSANVYFTGGTTFTGPNANLGDYATLYWSQNGTLAGKTVSMGVTSGAYGVIAVGANNSLTLDAATTITGGVYIYGNTGATLTNQGTITQTSSATGYLFAPTLVNQGSLTMSANGSFYFGYYSAESTTNASGGTLTADGANARLYAHNLVNQGTVTAKNGGSIIFVGTNVTSDFGNSQIGPGGGHLYLSDTLDNSAATLNTPGGGSFELYGGTISNGTIAPGALAFTGSGGTLNAVTINGDLALPASSYVTFAGGTSFTGANATLNDYSTLYWSQNSTLTGKALTLGSATGYGDIYVNSGYSLTLDPTSSVTGGIYLYGASGSTITNQGTITQTSANTGYLYGNSFVNQGTVSVNPGSYLYMGYYSTDTVTNSPGATVLVNGGALYIGAPLTNNGTIKIQSGTLYANGNLNNGPGGVITGAGTISGNLALAAGFLSPGNNGIGTLTFVNSGFSVINTSTLNIDIGGTTADQLVFQNPTSVVDIGAGLLTANVTLLSAPAPGTIYNIFVISSGGSGMSGFLNGLPVTGSAFATSFGGVPYDFTVTYLANGISFQAVPEPGTVGLMSAGAALLTLQWWRRRRNRA